MAKIFCYPRCFENCTECKKVVMKYINLKAHCGRDFDKEYEHKKQMEEWDAMINGTK